MRLHSQFWAPRALFQVRLRQGDGPHGGGDNSDAWWWWWWRRAWGRRQCARGRRRRRYNDSISHAFGACAAHAGGGSDQRPAACGRGRRHGRRGLFLRILCSGGRVQPGRGRPCGRGWQQTSVGLAIAAPTLGVGVCAYAGGRCGWPSSAGEGSTSRGCRRLHHGGAVPQVGGAGARHCQARIRNR